MTAYRTDTVIINPSRVTLPIPRKLHPAVRCHARRTDGEPCSNWAMHGQTVCHAHGGKSPLARAAAWRRLAVAAAEAYLAGELSYWHVVDQQRAADRRKLLGLDAKAARREAKIRAQGEAILQEIAQLRAELLGPGHDMTTGSEGATT